MSAEASPRGRTTALLQTADPADAPSLDRLVPLIYEELRAMAHRQLAGESPDHTLRTTALVHEAYARLVDDTRVTRKGRAYFFAAAARAMRRVLVDHARRRGAQKRRGERRPVTLDEETAGEMDAFSEELLDLEDALNRLAELEPRQVQVVECRFFGGLSVDETADALGVSPRTVKYDWAMARAWLYSRLRPGEAENG